MIELRKVSKFYSTKIILDTINLDFEKGKTHILLGSSGSGKSTLLRMIVGIIKPDSGEIWIDHEPMCSATQRGLCQKMGYVIQEGGLFPHLTAQENVSLVARTLHWSEDQIRIRMTELLDWVGLTPSLMTRFPNELSGGQRQRIGIMRACFLNPQIMLLDEPLGALDPIVRADLQKELKQIFIRFRQTVILVTHDMGEAAYFGDTITLLHSGKILQTGTFEELLHHPTDPFVTQFIYAQRDLQRWTQAS